MRVLVTGVRGQLGHDVVRVLAARGHEAIGVDVGEMDITDRDACLAAISEARPDAVVHCAAWTAVDMAEDDGLSERVFRVNADGTRNVALACAAVGAKMAYISTDYVFSGQGVEPWKPDCEDFRPLNAYGRSKLEGERAVSEILERFFVVRTAWVFGLNGKNFVKTMLALSQNHDAVRVVNDQIGTPTYALDLARLLADMIESDRYGYYHATNEGGYISWADFAEEIFRQAGKHTAVVPVSTSEYGLNKAARPFNSRLDKRKLREAGFALLPPWKDALAEYLSELAEADAKGGESGHGPDQN